MRKITTNNISFIHKIMTQRFCKLLFYSIIILSWLEALPELDAQTPVLIIQKDTKPVAIREWLVAGAFPSADVDIKTKQSSSRIGYSTDFLKPIGGESKAKIRSGTIIKTKEGERIKFKPYKWNVDYLNLSDVLGKLSNVCAYLYTELESEIEQTVILHLGTNDAGKLWVNGKLLSYNKDDRAAYRSQSTAQIILKPGQRTSILLKIDQGGGGWGAFLEVYGYSAHQKFMNSRIPKTIGIEANSQSLTLGDTLKAHVIKYSSNNFFELNVPVKWELEDRGLIVPLDGDADKINFIISDGSARQLSLHGTKKIGDKELKGIFRFLVRQKELKSFTESGNILDIGNQRELFIDYYLISKLIDTKLVLHEPQDKGEVIRFDKPWEGPFCAYFTIIKENEKFKLFYRGTPKAGADGNKGEVTCYAESKDGINWKKPNIGIYEIMGTRENNVILANDAPFSHNFSPFLDTKPNIPVNEKFKAVAGVHDTGLFGYTSADGVHWKKIGKSPIFTKGIFDSQNVVFWSQNEELYVCYFRTWTGPAYTGKRTVSRTTSKDFTHWTEPEKMDFGFTELEHLYTNQTHAYFRAPHIYVAIAARFMPNRQVITKKQALQLKVNPSYFNDCSDVVFMTSRGGNKYDRTFMEGFIRPGIGLQNWVSRTNYPVLNVVQTSPNEMSLYVQKDYAQPTAHLKRYSLRLDGFCSIEANYSGGEMISKPLIFKGEELILNFATSAAGFIKVEILDENGSIIKGFELYNSKELIGNEIEKVVSWKTNPNLKKLIDRPIRLRFVMKDANLYSMMFR